jgi:acyl carrier protein
MKLTKKELEQLKTIVADQINCEETEITPSAHFQHDLGGDSLDFTELIMSVEEHFDIMIDDAEAEKCVTFDKLVEMVESKRL